VVVLVLFLAATIFWSVFEQAGSTLNLFAQRNTLTEAFGVPFPPSWLQSVAPFSLVVLAPVFAWIWLRLGPRDPSSPTKFTIGLVCVALSFAILVIPAQDAEQGIRVSPLWLVATYLLHTCGELCLSPVGLSSMTKLAPARFVGQVMGLWFLATAIGNNLAGQFSGEFDPNNLPGMPDRFLYLMWWGVLAGAVLLVLTPFIRKMMGGVK